MMFCESFLTMSNCLCVCTKAFWIGKAVGSTLWGTGTVFVYYGPNERQ